MLHSSLFMSAVIMIVAAGVGFLLGYIGQRVATQRMRRETEERTRHLLHEAEKEAESKKREAALEAQASWYQAKAGIEQEVAATKLELQSLRKKFSSARRILSANLSILKRKNRSSNAATKAWSSVRNSTCAKSRNSLCCSPPRYIP